MHKNTTRQFRMTPGPMVCAVSLLSLVAGCITPWERSALLKDNTPDISRIQGPTQRSLTNLFKKQQEEEDKVAGKSLKPIKGTEEYLAATELYKEEKYEDARKAFKAVAKKFKKSEIREDALFMQAESAWKQEHYATAHDTYAVLLKEYPSTRHLNVVVENLFSLGRRWLDFPEVAKVEEIKQVNFDQPTNALPPEDPTAVPKRTSMIKPNFTNKKEPLFDTPGNGVAALTAVWMNDPTGPLADDAMMLVASYHARKGNYVEADRFFQMLRETFPNSPHVQNAFVLGSHVKLMSYQGPEYETRQLQEAQLLKESTLKLYPNLPEADRIRDELARIEEAKALVMWKNVEFYLNKKDNKRAAAIYCHELIHAYPKSSYAKKARSTLVNLGPEYTNGAIFLQSKDQKKTGVLEQVLENPIYRLKKYPMVGSPRDTNQAKKNQSTKSDGGSKSDSTSNPKSNSSDGDKMDGYEEPADEVERAPQVNPEKQSKPRSWLNPFGSPPRKLPDSDNSDNLQSTSASAGRTRVQ